MPIPASSNPSSTRDRGGKLEAAVEIIQKADNVTDGIDHGNQALKAISASEAFRKYDWLEDAPIRNINGNLRGMVLNRRWRTVFQITADVGPAIAKANVIAGFAVFIADAGQQIDAILKSGDGWGVKGPKLCLAGSSAAIHSLTGMVKGPVDILAFSLEGYGGAADLAIGRITGKQGQIASRIKALDTHVTSFIDNINAKTSAEQLYTTINTYFVLR